MVKQDTAAMKQFTRDDTRIAELLKRMQEIADLSALGALAEWDQNTSMPEGAGEVRGDQMATLQGVLHDRWTSEHLGKLLEELQARSEQTDLTDADRGLIRDARRSYERTTRLPRTLVEEMARVQ